MAKGETTSQVGSNTGFDAGDGARYGPSFQRSRVACAEGLNPISAAMVADATKEQLAETARILALQAAHCARRYSDLPLSDLQALLSATRLNAEMVQLLRDGTEALAAVLPTLAGIEDDG